MRLIKFSEAIAEATVQAMENDPRLFVMGEGVDDAKGSFGTTLEPYRRFGAERVFDTPLSESAMTGIGIGAAIEGRPCLMVHLRTEFLLLAMDQVVNHAAKWRYMFAGQMGVPITIRCIVGRGWGQAAQHSQSFHSMYAQVPGLKVVLPATARAAKGLLYAALRDPDPVIVIEHRWLHEKVGEVPEAPYETALDRAEVLMPGEDVTCVALSYAVYEAMQAAERLRDEGIRMEVVDLRSVRPIDSETILRSVRKTGRLLVTDIASGIAGVAAEVIALTTESALDALKAPPVRVALPDAPTPCSPALEKAYYPTVDDLMVAARRLVRARARNATREIAVESFQGPF